MNLAQVWIPLLAVMLSAGATIYNKVLFNKTKISSKDFLVYQSIWLAILALPMTFLAGGIDFQAALSPKYLLLFFAMLILALAANWWTMKGFRESNLIRFDLIVMLQPLMVMVLAGIVIIEERNPQIWAVAGVSLAALMFAHFRRGQISFDKGERMLLFGAIAWGMHEVLIRLLLDVYEPSTLYFIRIGILAVIFGAAFKSPLRSLTSKFVIGSLISAIITLAGVLLTYYSYQIFGVTVTNLIGLLYPIIIYAAAVEMFGVREKAKMLIAALIILASLGYLMLIVL